MSYEFKSAKDCKDVKNDQGVVDINEFLKKFDVLQEPRDYYINLEKNYTPPKNKITAITKNNEDYLKILDKRLKHKIYRNIDKTSIKNTFFYILHKFNIGLYISIRNNKIHKLNLIRNRNMKYPYDTKLNPKYYDQYNIQSDTYWKPMGCIVNSILNPDDTAKIIYKDVNSRRKGLRPVWYYWEIKEWLQILLENRKISDVDFFMNLFDQVTLTDNNTEPSFYHYPKRKIPLKREQTYGKMCPIITLSHTMDGYLDLPFITPDDINRISQKVFPDACNDTYMTNKGTINTDWSKKIATAVFRGSSTGCGTTIKNNPRIRLAYFNVKWSKDDNFNNNNKIDKLPYLNAGLTSHNIVFKKHEDDKYIEQNPDNIQNEDLDNKITLIDPLTMSEQSNYKYIINIDGYVSAFRLTFLFSFNSVVLSVKSDYRPWFYCHLIDYENIIFINKDLSNLAEVVTWLKKNDDKAKKIAQNGCELYKKLFSKKGLLDYSQLLLNKIAENN